MIFIRCWLVVFGVLIVCCSSDVSAQGNADQRPVISEIRNLQIVKHSNSRSLSCDVAYSGANFVIVNEEEDFSSAVRTVRVNGPSLAHIQIDGIVLHYTA